MYLEASRAVMHIFATTHRSRHCKAPSASHTILSTSTDGVLRPRCLTLFNLPTDLTDFLLLGFHILDGF